MELLLALSGAALLYFLQSILYRRFWDSKLSVDIKFSKDSAIEGEEISLVEVITNRKLLPLPILQVKFMTSRCLVFKDTDNSKVSDHYYRNDMVSVMMFQKLTKLLTFECSQRGYYTISRIDAVCSDLFMTHEEVDTFDLNIQLYVYPKPIDFTRMEIAFNKMLGAVLTKRFINEDPFEFRNIREYQSYDNLRMINWKASAKTDDLKVNVHDYTSSQQVKILLNTESDTIWKYDDLNEESIRIASSLAQAFIGQGIPVSVYTNAKDLITKETLEVPAGSGSNHFRQIEEALTRIDLTLEPKPFMPIIQEQLMNLAVKDFLIIISYYQREDLQQLMLAQKQAKKDFAWIVPMNHEVKITVCDELGDKMIPWEIVE
jgi:uncharacterized protein (DUF58 family)